MSRTIPASRNVSKKSSRVSIFRNCFSRRKAFTCVSSKTSRVSPFRWRRWRSRVSMNWNSLSTRKWPEETTPSDSRSRRTSSTSSASRPRATASSVALYGPSTSSRFGRLQAGPLCVDRDVVRYVVLRRPMDALRRPDTLDQSFVHKLAGPFSDVGEGCGRDVEHVPTLLLQKVRVTYAIQVRQDVFLPGDLRELSS